MLEKVVQCRILVLVATALFGFASAAQAEDRSWEAAVAQLAKKLEMHIKANGGKARAEHFQPSGAFKSNPASGVFDELRKALNAGNYYSDGADFVIVGRIDSHELDGGKVVVLIQARINKNGEEITRAEKVTISGSSAVAFVGGNYEPAPNTKPEELRDKLEESPRTAVPGITNKKPSDPVIIENKAKAREDGLFAMEIVVVTGERKGPCSFSKAPLVFADLKKDEEFHVVLHNNSKFEVVASLKIDGLNVLNTFRGTKNLGYIVQPGESATIQGWQIDNKKAETFKIVDLHKSVFFQKNKLDTRFPPDLGNITAEFRRSSANGTPGGNGEDQGQAVGRGKEVESHVTEVQRYYDDQPYSVITIRYRR